MSTTISKTVRLLSRMHKTTNSIIAGEKRLEEIVFSPEHFKKFLAVSMTTSCLAGFYATTQIRQSRAMNSAQVYLAYE